MLRRIWALTVKEFLVIWADRRSRVVIIVPPLLQLLVFGTMITTFARPSSTRTAAFRHANSSPGSRERRLSTSSPT